MELLHVRALCVLRRDDARADDLDGARAAPVAASHLRVCSQQPMSLTERKYSGSNPSVGVFVEIVRVPSARASVTPWPRVYGSSQHRRTGDSKSSSNDPAGDDSGKGGWRERDTKRQQTTIQLAGATAVGKKVQRSRTRQVTPALLLWGARAEQEQASFFIFRSRNQPLNAQVLLGIDRRYKPT